MSLAGITSSCAFSAKRRLRRRWFRWRVDGFPSPGGTKVRRGTATFGGAEAPLGVGLEDWTGFAVDSCTREGACLDLTVVVDLDASVLVCMVDGDVTVLESSESELDELEDEDSEELVFELEELLEEEEEEEEEEKEEEEGDVDRPLVFRGAVDISPGEALDLKVKRARNKIHTILFSFSLRTSYRYGLVLDAMTNKNKTLLIKAPTKTRVKGECCSLHQKIVFPNDAERTRIQ